MAQMIAMPLTLGKNGQVRVKNRVCVPPMVLFGHAEEDGIATDFHVAQYRSYAKGGAGLIIQEATCISPEGRLSKDQLGLWSDAQIPGLREITDAVHGEGCPIVVQIHHAGIMSTEEPRLCPSPYVYKRAKKAFVGQRLSTEFEEICGTELTEEGIDKVRADFIYAARRAKAAGYDGVELHGCHSYLLSQFLNHNVNTRTDAYADGMKLISELVEAIRAINGADFLVGIRLGGFEPDLDAGIAHAKALADLGVDFLDISYGFTGEMNTDAPGDAQFLPIIRAAAAISEAVSIPVFAVDGIRTPEQAETILRETNVSMVDVGRSTLVDPAWAAKAVSGKKPGMCLRCDVCQWRINPDRCPGRVKMRMEGKT